MYSVTQRIRRIQQPYGGYLPIRSFHATTLDDGNYLIPDENIHGSLVGLCVDYMTRFLNGTPAKEAFFISLAGAYELDLSSKKPNQENPKTEFNRARELLSKITGLNEDSVIHACKLVGYDVCFRAGTTYYQPVDAIEPNWATIHNITVMIQRSLSFLQQYGPIVKDGFTFEGGYTRIVSSGDGDFITKDTLWDFKVLKTKPSSRDTLQLLMYYLMGRRSIHPELHQIQNIGFFNPRSNTIYRMDVSDIPEDVISTVESEVIGYESPRKENVPVASFTKPGKTKKRPQKIDFANPQKIYPLGSEINHPAFGKGVVVEIRPTGALHLTKVRFGDGYRLLCTSKLNQILQDEK